MVSTTHKRAARRALDRVGRDVTLRNYERSESGGRESWSATASSPHTITARVDRTQSPTTDRSLRETGEPEADVSVYIRDDASGASNIRDGGGEGASEIDVDGVTYAVIQRDVQDNGLYALECERVS